MGVIHCEKIRNVKNGEILETIVHKEDLGGHDAIIVDDICVGGRTFIEIAKILKKRNCGKITLMVSHGIFSNGLEVFRDLIDEIYTKDARLK